MGDLTLGFDTATDLTTVAVVDPSSETLSERRSGPAVEERPAHASDLLPAIEDSVTEAGGWERIGKICVGVGPGSFTGIRVAVATGRALAQATGCDVVPVSTLAALAEGAGGLTEADGRDRLAVLDARPNEAFLRLMAPDGSVLIEDCCVDSDGLAEIVEAAGSVPVAFGDGSLRFASELEACGAEVLESSSPAHSVSAADLCRLAPGSAVGSIDEIEPVYLREPDARRWLERGVKSDD